MRLLARLIRVVSDSRRAAVRHGVSTPRVMRRLVRSYLERGLLPHESLHYGLTDPGLGEDRISGCIGKGRLPAQRVDLSRDSRGRLALSYIFDEAGLSGVLGIARRWARGLRS